MENYKIAIKDVQALFKELKEDSCVFRKRMEKHSVRGDLLPLVQKPGHAAEARVFVHSWPYREELQHGWCCHRAPAFLVKIQEGQLPVKHSNLAGEAEDVGARFSGRQRASTRHMLLKGFVHPVLELVY